MAYQHAELGATLRPVLAAIRSQPFVHPGSTAKSVAPFVTISRSAGAGGKQLAEALVDRLTAMDPAGQPWTSWDRELVEKVAADHGISRDLIESITEINRTWLDRFFDDIATNFASSHASEFKVYRRVASTIRALAQAGHVVVVGRGGVYITRDMPGGVHVRLVAPLEQRIANIAHRMGYSHEQAARYVRDTDRAREHFCREHFLGELFAPERFSVTFNTSMLSTDQIVDCIVTLLKPPGSVR
ncbi:MAG: cytidylate kinase-like family protein [Tepidisphaeraceae bacterium]|jgi:cytidylate kinase